MSRATSNGNHHDTKQALLEVGKRCFASKGYMSTSVREICGQAGANVAAVNYHFGGKFELYKAVLFGAFENESPAGWPPPSLADSPDDPEHALRLFVRWFIERMLRAKGNTTVRDLIHHELREPTGALDLLVEQTMKPTQHYLRDIIMAITEDQLSDQVARQCCISILGQCLVYKQCLPMLETLFGSACFAEDRIDDIADHVFRFALAGVRAEAEAAAEMAPAIQETPA